MIFEEILNRFDAKKSGSKYMAKCPAHSDSTASLSISKGDDGRTLLKCFAGCSNEAICEAKGLTLADLFSGTKKALANRNWVIVATYIYTDEHGEILFQVNRTNDKQFLQQRPDGKGGWIWNAKGVRRVLYRLPEVLKAETVVIVEGEKDANNVSQLGLCATCNSMGAGKWRDEYSESLRGKHVVVIPDNDETGREHATRVAASLAGKAKSIKWLDLPNDANGTVIKDASDFLKLFPSGDALRDLIDKAPEYTPQPEPKVAEPAQAAPELQTVDWRKTIHTVSELATGDIRIFIKGMLPEGINAIGSLSGVGKTWFSLCLAKALTTGEKFLGIYDVLEPMPVLYLCPEMGEKAFRKRAEKVHIPMDDKFFCQTIADGLNKLTNSAIIAAIKELQPVVFLDTLIRFSAVEDENASRQAAKQVAAEIFEIMRLGARAMVVLHHSPKYAADADYMTLENVLRGTGDLGAMTDCVWGLQHDKQKLPNGKAWNHNYAVESQQLTRLYVQNVKSRDFDPAQPFRIVGRPYLDETGSFVVLSEDNIFTKSLEELVAEEIRLNPMIKQRELKTRFGIGTDRLLEVAKEQGWWPRDKKDGGGWERINEWDKGLGKTA